MDNQNLSDLLLPYVGEKSMPIEIKLMINGEGSLFKCFTNMLVRDFVKEVANIANLDP